MQLISCISRAVDQRSMPLVLLSVPYEIFIRSLSIADQRLYSSK
jgi:hypothetical protein